MSRLRIIVVDCDVTSRESADAVLQILRESLGREVPPAVVSLVQREPVATPAARSEETRPSVAKAVPRGTTPESRPAKQTGDSIQSKILAAFREDPTVTKPELAKRVYGDALPETIQRLQSNIYMMVSTKKLRRVGMGRYEVLA